MKPYHKLRNAAERRTSSFWRAAPLRHLLSALCLLLTAAARPVLADTVSTSASDGFGRILFTLDPLAHGEVALSGGVLVVTFDRKIDIDPNAIAQGLAPYVSSARIDPDGRTLRVALVQEIKPHVSTSTNRIAIDLTPPTFSGTPPDLPQPAPKDAPLDTSALPTIPVRVGTYPGFTRIVFDWPQRVAYRESVKDGHLKVHFSTPANIDIAPIERASPPWVKQAGSRVDSHGTIQEFEIDEDSNHHISRDGNKIVLDVLVPKSDATNISAHDNTGKPVSPEPASNRLSPSQKQEIAATAAQLNGTGETTRGTSPPVTSAQVESNPAAKTLSAVEPQQPPLAQRPSVATVKVTGEQLPHGVALTFPRAQKLAAFVRGLTAWIVVDGGAPVDIASLQSELGTFATSVDFTSEGDQTIVRIGLHDPQKISAAIQNDTLKVTIDANQAKLPAAIQLTRDDDQKRPVLATRVPGATRTLSVVDPTVGDSLVIIPSSVGYGVPRQRSYIQFTNLQTAAGMVIVPSTDDLDIAVSQSRLSISCPDGLSLTQATAPVATSPAAFVELKDGPTFIDFTRWAKTPGNR